MTEPDPATWRQVRRRFLVGLLMMFGTAAIVFAVLNIVQPMGCHLVDAFLSQPGCQQAIAGYILHIIAAALAGILTLFPMLTWMRRIEKKERDRDERLHES